MQRQRQTCAHAFPEIEPAELAGLNEFAYADVLRIYRPERFGCGEWKGFPEEGGVEVLLPGGFKRKYSNLGGKLFSFLTIEKAEKSEKSGLFSRAGRLFRLTIS